MADIKKTTAEVGALNKTVGDTTDALNSMNIAGAAAKVALSALEAPALTAYDNISLLGKGVDSLGSGFTDAYKSVKDFTGGLEGFTKTVIAFTDNLVKLRAGTLQFVGAFDQGIGKANSFTESIIRTQTAVAQFGGTTADSAEALLRLNDSLSVVLGPALQNTFEQLSPTITQLNRFRVSTKESTDAFTDLRILFKQSPSDFNLFSRRIAAFSDQTGMDFKKVFTGAKQSLDTFAEGLSSQETLSKFLRFQLASQRTGLAVGQLKGMLDRFDTIEGAQQAGGQLAAVFRQFGISFNATSFAFATQEEQQQILSEKTKELLPQLQNMNRKSRRLILSQVGEGLGLSATAVARLARGGAAAGGIDAALAGGGLPTGVTQGQFEAAARRQLAADRQRALRAAREAALGRATLRGTAAAGTDIAGIAENVEKLNTLYGQNLDKVTSVNRALGGLVQGAVTLNDEFIKQSRRLSKKLLD